MSDEANPQEDRSESAVIRHPDLEQVTPDETPAEAQPDSEAPEESEEPEEPEMFVMEVPGVGTYKGETQEELMENIQKAMASSAEEARRLHQENLELKSHEPQPRQDTLDQNAVDWRDTLRDQGIDPDSFSQALSGWLSEASKPLMEVSAADSALAQSMDGYNASRLDEYINTNPEVSQTYSQLLQANPRAAREWAHGQFRASEAGRELSRAKSRSKADKNAVDQDRATAATISTRHRAADVNTSTAAAAVEERKRKAIERYHETGSVNEDQLLDELMPIDHPDFGGQSWWGKPELESG